MEPWTIQKVQSRYWRAYGYRVLVRKHGVSIPAVNAFRQANPSIQMAFSTRPLGLMFGSKSDLMLFKLSCAGT